MNSSINSSILGPGAIFLIGFMGSGKTHWGRLWADQKGIAFFDLDKMIEEEEKKTIAGIFETKGEVYFRKKETEILKRFEKETNYILACGGGAPCYYDNIKWMNDTGTTIYLCATPKYIYDRVLVEKDKRPLLKNLTPGELFLFIEQKLKEREPIYKQAQIILPVEELNTDSIRRIINY